MTGGAAKGIMSGSGLPTASMFLLNPIPNMTEVSKPGIHCLMYLHSSEEDLGVVRLRPRRAVGSE